MSHGRWNDDFGDGPFDEDPEGPLESDLEAASDDDESDTLPCPNCGHEISELAQQCPHCGDWIVLDGPGSKRKPLLVAIAILLLIVFLLWVF